MDYDADTESFTMNAYMTIDVAASSGTARFFIGYDVTDTGTDTSTLSSFGIVAGTFYCSSEDGNYINNGDGTFTMDGEPATVTLSNGGNTITIIDPDDAAEYSVWNKIDSITAT